MKEARDDRRTRYTKKVIREGFIQLLQKKPISAITVKELCEIADVNRSTFYTHYDGIYDLMDQIKAELSDEIHAWLSGLIFSVDSSASSLVMKTVFEFVLANADLCKVLLGENGDVSLQESIMMLVQEQVVKDWPSGMTEDSELAQYLCEFSVHAGVAMIQKWLQNGLKEEPEKMAKLTMQLIFHGLSSVVAQ